MSHAENKVNWCLKKAEKEMDDGGKHRGLVRVEPSDEIVQSHILKAEHNLKAITAFKEAGFSDWSASAAFYCAYHCLLAVIAGFGYESRNQECTFALIYHLIETGQVDLDKALVEKIHSADPAETHESPTIIEMREAGQYGVSMSLEDDMLGMLLGISKTFLDRVKELVETKKR